MNYLYNTLNDPKRMTVREHAIQESYFRNFYERL